MSVTHQQSILYFVGFICKQRNSSFGENAGFYTIFATYLELLLGSFIAPIRIASYNVIICKARVSRLTCKSYVVSLFSEISQGLRSLRKYC